MKMLTNRVVQIMAECMKLHGRGDEEFLLDLTLAATYHKVEMEQILVGLWFLVLSIKKTKRST